MSQTNRGGRRRKEDGFATSEPTSRMTHKYTYPIGQKIPGTSFVAETYLGAGGMGEVYGGKDTRTQRPLAMKVLRLDLRNFPEIQERFKLEGELLGRLHPHPNLPEVVYPGTTLDEHRLPYFTMELLRCYEARRLIGRGQHLAPTNAVEIMIPVFSVLHHAHARGILHCDVKPDNILIHNPSSGIAVPKLTDFGIGHAPSLRRGSAVLGTPPYAAPEQLRGERLTGKVDVYGAGMTLYELLTGHTAFRDDRACLTESPMPPSAHVSDLPRRLENLVLRMISTNASERPDAEEAELLLRDLHHELVRASQVGDPHRRVTVKLIPVSVGEARDDVAKPRALTTRRRPGAEAVDTPGATSQGLRSFDDNKTDEELPEELQLEILAADERERAEREAAARAAEPASVTGPRHLTAPSRTARLPVGPTPVAAATAAPPTADLAPLLTPHPEAISTAQLPPPQHDPHADPRFLAAAQLTPPPLAVSVDCRATIVHPATAPAASTRAAQARDDTYVISPYEHTHVALSVGTPPPEGHGATRPSAQVSIRDERDPDSGENETPEAGEFKLPPRLDGRIVPTMHDIGDLLKELDGPPPATFLARVMAWTRLSAWHKAMWLSLFVLLAMTVVSIVREFTLQRRTPVLSDTHRAQTSGAP